MEDCVRAGMTGWIRGEETGKGKEILSRFIPYATPRCPLESLVSADHDVGSFNDSIDILAGLQTEPFRGRLGDDGDDLDAAGNPDDDFRVNGTGRDLFYLAFKDIAGTDLHDTPPCLLLSIQ
jgi:hypothetical protein